MKKLLLIALLFSSGAFAQQVCLTTTGTAQITSDPYPNTGRFPTSCNLYKPSQSPTVPIATGLVAPSSSIPSTNICLPPNATYIPGPTTNVSCLVTIPAQPAGSVTLTMTAVDALGESAQSAPITFISAASLPTLPAPTNLRVIP
jgi:hypothetical protein